MEHFRFLCSVTFSRFVHECLDVTAARFSCQYFTSDISTYLLLLYDIDIQMYYVI